MSLINESRLKQPNRVMQEHFGIRTAGEEYIVALAGNPNVGKSTVFNALTGLRQHTGNWPGKTVDNAQGTYFYKNRAVLLVDLPGTYSLLAHSVEEEIARDFICFAKPSATIVVLDATSLERNLNLALQIMEITDKVVVCVNMIDEARKKKISIQFDELERKLGVPVIPTAARNGEGLEKLQEAVDEIVLEKQLTLPKPISYSPEVEEAIRVLMPQIEPLNIGDVVNPKWLALRLLDSDKSFIESINQYINAEKKAI